MVACRHPQDRSFEQLSEREPLTLSQLKFDSNMCSTCQFVTSYAGREGESCRHLCLAITATPANYNQRQTPLNTKPYERGPLATLDRTRFGL